MSPAHTAPTLAPVVGQLRNRLLSLDYPAFGRCICRLLEALGYEDAHLAGRREWKGYNRPGGGGYDLEANLPGGLAPRRVVAQIKQFDALTVHQRSVDELRGACLRAGAAEGLLVTTSAFSGVVRACTTVPNSAGSLVAPVRLLDGEELVGLLIRHRLGVRERSLCGLRRFSGIRKRESANTRIRKLELDEAFFGSLAAPSRPPSVRRRSVLPGWRLTIRISSSANLRAKRSGRTGDTDMADREEFDRKGGR